MAAQARFQDFRKSPRHASYALGAFAGLNYVGAQATGTVLFATLRVSAPAKRRGPQSAAGHLVWPDVPSAGLL